MNRKEWLNNKAFTMQEVRVCKFPDGSITHSIIGDIFKTENSSTLDAYSIKAARNKVSTQIQAFKDLIAKTVDEFEARKTTADRNFGITKINVAVQHDIMLNNMIYHLEVIGRWMPNSEYDEIAQNSPKPETNLEQYLYTHATELFSKELVKTRSIG